MPPKELIEYIFGEHGLEQFHGKTGDTRAVISRDIQNWYFLINQARSSDASVERKDIVAKMEDLKKAANLIQRTLRPNTNTAIAEDRISSEAYNWLITLQFRRLSLPSSPIL